MPEQGLFFNNFDNSKLFGVIGMPVQPKGTGVVFCHSFSDEAQNSYRTVVSISRCLMKAGVPVLRFDSAGFGESSGEIGCASVSTMVKDAQAAAELLCKQAGIDRVVFVGIRFGAFTALQAAESLPQAAGVALVSPVIDGRKFSNELIRGVQFAEMGAIAKPRTRAEIVQKMHEDGYIELEGGLVSKQMMQEISETNLMTKPGDYQGPLAVALVPGNRLDAKSASLAEVYKEQGCLTETWSIDDYLFWTNQATFDPRVPVLLIQKLIHWISCLP